MIHSSEIHTEWTTERTNVHTPSHLWNMMVLSKGMSNTHTSMLFLVAGMTTKKAFPAGQKVSIAAKGHPQTREPTLYAGSWVLFTKKHATFRPMYRKARTRF